MIKLGNRTNTILLVGALALFTVFPFVVSGFWIRLFTSIFLFAVMAQGLNVIAGFTGYAAFGQMIFFGLGAYTAGIIMTKGLPFFLPALVGAGLVGILAAILIGFPLLRLKGHYFALASLGACEAVRHLLDNITEIGGGASGLSLPQMFGKPEQVNTNFYYIVFLLLIFSFSLTFWVSKNRIGYAFKAIKANEEAAEVTGINTTYYKIVAWSISGLFTACAGAIYAYWFTYIQPETVFDVVTVVKLFVIMLLGGAGTVMGPLYGAFILEGISEIVWSKFLHLHMGILGMLIILICIFLPNGLIDMIRRGFRLKTILDILREGKI
jgi:branched-chain amino acid transport system permease protein